MRCLVSNRSADSTFIVPHILEIAERAERSTLQRILVKKMYYFLHQESQSMLCSHFLQYFTFRCLVNSRSANSKIHRSANFRNCGTIHTSDLSVRKYVIFIYNRNLWDTANTCNKSMIVHYSYSFRKFVNLSFRMVLKTAERSLSNRTLQEKGSFYFLN